MTTRSFEAFGGQVFCISPELNDDLLAEVQAEADRLEHKFSRFIADSDLNRLNQNLDTDQEVDEEFYDLLTQAKRLELLTGGYLNVGMKGLIESWGYDAEYRLDTETDFYFSQKTFDLNDDRTVRIYNMLDFGSFGKGYFLDQAVKIFQDSSVDNFLINAGGDLVIKNQPQTIYFEDPRNPKLMIGEANIDNMFMAGSSPVRRQWRDKHHLINPFAKNPADLMLGVYVQSDKSGLMVDAVSTALFVMGFQEAQNWLSKNPEYQGLLISETGQIWKTDNFTGELYSAKTSSSF